MNINYLRLSTDETAERGRSVMLRYACRCVGTRLGSPTLFAFIGRATASPLRRFLSISILYQKLSI